MNYKEMIKELLVIFIWLLIFSTFFREAYSRYFPEPVKEDKPFIIKVPHSWHEINKPGAPRYERHE